jgi:hypothetical protein
MSSRGRSSLLGIEEQRPIYGVREVALERPASLSRSLSFRTFARQELLRLVVASRLCEGDGVKGPVQLTVPHRDGAGA